MSEQTEKKLNEIIKLLKELIDSNKRLVSLFTKYDVGYVEMVEKDGIVHIPK